MKRFYRFPLYSLLAGALMCAAEAEAQSVFPSQQAAVRSNNLILKAGIAECEATGADNLTGLTLPNPEVSFSYMFGQPSDVPNKTNIEVTQSFDFATLSGAKRRLAEANNAIAAADVQAERQKIALEVENLLINYVYQTRLCAQLEKQLELVSSLDEQVALALKKGNVTMLEYNRVSLEKMAKEIELAEARQEQENLVNQLITLNGGQNLELPADWPDAPLPASFDAWLADACKSNAELQVLALNIERDNKEVELRKKEGLPEFSVGYTNELVKDANYHGFAIGFSLPLWGNRGRVKSAESVRAASQMRLQSAVDEYADRKKSEYNKALMLAETSRNYVKLYTKIEQDNLTYLKKALDKGVINMIEYMSEQEDFFEHAMKCQEAVRDYQLARAALYAETL